MIYQNRPFFRKNIRLNDNLPKLNIWGGKFTSFKNSKKSKLIQHKYQKTLRFGKHLHTNKFKLNSLLWQVSSIGLDNFGRVGSVVLSNYLGLQELKQPVRGVWINSIASLTYYKKFAVLAHNNYRFVQAGPISYVSVSGKLLASQSGAMGIWDGSGIRVTLPSSKIIHLHTGHISVGSPLNNFSKRIGITSIVRGIAKNPVDHPNGGRANTKGSFKTPWGAIAKNNK